VLISQIQRSGGTLLSQLFEGHPKCHHHPDELYIGHPKKWNWPVLNLDGSPLEWFRLLFEPHTLKFFRNGYQKNAHIMKDSETYPFLLLPNLQKEIFLNRITNRKISSQRAILNCYMQSYFDAWLDYLYPLGDKKYILAFVPRLSMIEESVKSFFTDYPDGKLISMIREPKNWYSSASRHEPDTYSNIKESMTLWEGSAKAMLLNKKEYSNRVYLMSYDQLVDNTEACMRHLTGWLGILFDEVLLSPTFQGRPIKADSSFKIEEYGIIKDTLKRNSKLDEADRNYIEDNYLDLYEEVIASIDG